MNEIINNVEYYLSLSEALEQAQLGGFTEQEDAITEELDNLWRELSSAEKDEVELLLGVQVGIGN